MLAEHVDALAAAADRWAARAAPGDALVGFLLEVIEKSAARQHVCDALSADKGWPRALLAAAGQRFRAGLERLLRDALQAGAVRAGLRVDDLTALAFGGAALCSAHPDPARGLSPACPPPPNRKLTPNPCRETTAADRGAGTRQHSGLYHRLGDALNGAGIELWALDEIGHGLTEGDRAVIESVDDLIENGRLLTDLAEEAQPGAPVWLAGHSLGSAAAAVSAVRDPGRYAGLILSGAALSPLDWVIALGGDDDAELDLDPADLSSDPFYLDELAHDPLAFTSAAGARSIAAVLLAAWGELADGFAQVPLPVLFVHGSEDPVVPAAHARDWAGRLKRVSWPSSPAPAMTC